MARKKNAKQPDNTQRSLIAEYDPKSPITEQFRTLRTNIQFSSIDKQLQSLMVTSSAPGEGKSTVAANLAIVLAQQEKRVLLVDADLRKPTVHYTFRTQNKYGLSTILTGQGNIEDIVLSEAAGSLDVIPSGPVPPNPSEMLSSNRMREFIEEAAKQYDYVVYDTPPANAVTDAQIMARLVDGVIFTVRSGVTNREEAAHAKDLLVKVGANLLGVVLNDTPADQSNYYYYYGTE